MKGRFLFDTGVKDNVGGTQVNDNITEQKNNLKIIGALRPNIIGQATAAQIVEWKKTYGEITWIKKDGKIAYFKSPGFAEMNAYHAAKDTDRITDAWKNLAGLLWIGGSEELKTSEKYLCDVHGKLTTLIYGAESEMGNL